MSTPRERAATLLQEMRSAGCTFTLGADGPRVRFSADCPSTPQLLQYIRENRQAVVELLRAEQGLAPQPAPEPERPRAVLVCGASKWPASKAGVILERLAKLPPDSPVMVYGNAETRNKHGIPIGAATVTRVALLGRKDVTVVQEDGLDEALGRVGYLLIFHPALDRSVGTAAVVAKARALQIPVEVISGSVTQEAAR